MTERPFPMTESPDLSDRRAPIVNGVLIADVDVVVDVVVDVDDHVSVDGDAHVNVNDHVHVNELGR